MNCTAQARLGKVWELDTTTEWFLQNGLNDWHMTGWVNIQTGIHYETYPQASRCEFRL